MRFRRRATSNARHAADAHPVRLLNSIARARRVRSGLRPLLSRIGLQSMRKLSTRLIIALLTFAVGITATTVWYLKRPSAHQEVRLIIPNAGWEPIFFRGINAVARLSGHFDLRKASRLSLWLRHITDLERSAIRIAIPDFSFTINSVRDHGRGVHPDEPRHSRWDFPADL